MESSAGLTPIPGDGELRWSIEGSSTLFKVFVQVQSAASPFYSASCHLKGIQNFQGLTVEVQRSGTQQEILRAAVELNRLKQLHHAAAFVDGKGAQQDV